MVKHLLSFVLMLTIIACNAPVEKKDHAAELDKLAEKYVRLGLEIGQYDGNFVDAYYGPDSLKPTTPKLDSFPKEQLLASVNELKTAFDQIAATTKNDTLSARATCIGKQLIAFGRRIKIFAGERKSFDEESKELFDVVPPVYDEPFFQKKIARLDSILPGKGSVAQRFQQLASRFVIPKNRLDTVFKATIAEARRRTLLHYSLPSNESFTLEYVTDKPWSGYNWYQGNFASLIQINATREILIDRAIDLACHEGYPGHHVYNMLLEKNLYRDKGWVEISLYPLFSPQSLIAEGSANYGIELAFPGNESNLFCKQVLLPLAGLDSSGIDTYFEALRIKGELNYARNEAARGLINGTMDHDEAMRWLTQYCLMDTKGAEQSINFIKTYRSYVINYNYGLDLVRNYISTNGGSNDNADKRWQIFSHLLSNEISPADLQKNK
jgi:hypothetical protein